MIKGVASETLTRVYQVADMPPVKRPFGTTTIVAETLTVIWSRTVEYGWQPQAIQINGWRGKGKNGQVASAIVADETWHCYRREGRADSWWKDKVNPPAWALDVAYDDCPADAALDPIAASVTQRRHGVQLPLAGRTDQAAGWHQLPGRALGDLRVITRVRVPSEALRSES
jgi:hypothetical protein